MSYFKHFIIITILFLNTKVEALQFLKKYEKVKNTDGKVIFESKDFSDGDDMYFTIEALGRCSSELEYGYFNTFEEITESSRTSYSVTYKSSSSSSTNGVTSSTLYFTLKKDSKEYNGSNGNYLLLQIDCASVDFENTEKDDTNNSTIIIIIVIVIVVFVVILGVSIGFSCYRRKKMLQMREMREANINQAPMMMYGAPQPMYPQQGNMMYMYGGQQAMVQPNGVPNNNPNMQNSNIPNNTPSSSRLAAQKNAVQQHNNNMIPQSS